MKPRPHDSGLVRQKKEKIISDRQMTNYVQIFTVTKQRKKSVVPLSNCSANSCTAPVANVEKMEMNVSVWESRIYTEPQGAGVCGLVSLIGSLLAIRHRNTLTGNSAADLAPSRPDAGTVPDHPILWSLVGFSHSVELLVDLIVAPFF